ncbi:MAG: winged helix-turn-helix domain-containing protein [Tabrizicola sp.]|nr:winged helix-turn-helix domain-containing protein [Tabrizicola sp.]
MVPFPFRQHDLADALGLSIVHTNRTIAALRRAGLVRISARRLQMQDHATLSVVATLAMAREDVRPILQRG